MDSGKEVLKLGLVMKFKMRKIVTVALIYNLKGTLPHLPRVPRDLESEYQGIAGMKVMAGKKKSEDKDYGNLGDLVRKER